MKTAIRIWVVCALALACGAIESRAADCMNKDDWSAWINKMPPPPDSFHVVGKLMASNPGQTAKLTPAVPQGVNPAILILDLKMEQKPGMWPQVLVPILARYDVDPYTGAHSQVTIRKDAECSITIDVKTVQ